MLGEDCVQITIVILLQSTLLGGWTTLNGFSFSCSVLGLCLGTLINIKALRVAFAVWDEKQQQRKQQEEAGGEERKKRATVSRVCSFLLHLLIQPTEADAAATATESKAANCKGKAQTKQSLQPASAQDSCGGGGGDDNNSLPPEMSV